MRPAPRLGVFATSSESVRTTGTCGRGSLPWPSFWRLQDVTGATHGIVDHGAAAGIDLLAEVGDIKLNDICPPAEVVVPNLVENLRLAQDPLDCA